MKPSNPDLMRQLRTMLWIAALFLIGSTSFAGGPLEPQAWKVTFPAANAKGRAIEILNPDFSKIIDGKRNLPSNLADYLQFSETEIVFKTEYTGVTTSSGTEYSRTELRQMNGAQMYNWKLSEKRSLQCRLKVSDLKGGANKLFVMQIHGQAPCTKPLLKIVWEKGHIRLLTKSGTKLKDFKKQQKYTHVGEDTWFTCRIDASSESLDISVNGERIESFGSDVLDFWPKDNTYYFKAGNYLQHNSQGAGATVNFSEIKLEEPNPE